MVADFPLRFSELSSTPDLDQHLLAALQSPDANRDCVDKQQAQAHDEEPNQLKHLLRVVHIDHAIQAHGPEEPVDEHKNGNESQDPEQIPEHG